MKINYMRVVLILMVLVVSSTFFLTVNRYLYGSFNIFANPVRIVYEGIHYNHRSSVKTLQLKEKPMIEVSRIFDIITGKKIFVKDKNFVGPGETIYLYLGEDKYILYSSGGGG
jgi:hypothetical protein